MQESFSIREFAKAHGIGPNKVRDLIARGELIAFDVSAPGSSRRRWRISQDAAADFAERRSSRHLVQTKRKRKAARATSYF